MLALGLILVLAVSFVLVLTLVLMLDLLMVWSAYTSPLWDFRSRASVCESVGDVDICEQVPARSIMIAELGLDLSQLPSRLRMVRSTISSAAGLSASNITTKAFRHPVKILGPPILTQWWVAKQCVRHCFHLLKMTPHPRVRPCNCALHWYIRRLFCACILCLFLVVVLLLFCVLISVLVLPTEPARVNLGVLSTNGFKAIRAVRIRFEKAASSVLDFSK